MKSNPQVESLSIGQAANRFGLATHVLRHWESMGLLHPERVGDRRRYRPEDLFQIAVVLRAKQGGLGLDDIAELYRAPDAAARDLILRQHRDSLARRIAEQRAALELIEHTLACEHENMLTCPHFRASVTALIPPALGLRP